jgi:hypothetical protein
LLSARLFEENQPMTWASIEDLVQFIDIFCLYDHLIVLGRPSLGNVTDENSDFVPMVRSSSILEVAEATWSEDPRARHMSTIAQRYLALLMGIPEKEVPDGFFETALSVQSALRYWESPETADPDTEFDLQQGRDALTELLSNLGGRQPIEE